MKKIYIEPTIDVVNIETQGLLAISSRLNFDDIDTGNGLLNDDYADEGTDAW